MQKIVNEFLVNTQTVGGQFDSSVTTLSNGDFVVTWQDSSGTLGDASLLSIKAQIFSASGAKVGSEFLVNTQTVDSQMSPSVTALQNGGFVVTWEDTSGFWDIKAQVFSASGAKLGGEFVVNTETGSQQRDPAVTALSGGGFVVTWYDYSGTLGDAEFQSVKAQVFDASGAKVGSEFLVNTQTAMDQTRPSVAALSNGGFVVTWDDYSGTLGDTSGRIGPMFPQSVKAQVFDASGAKVGSEFLVNTETASSQEAPSVAALSNGGFVVTWQDWSGTLGDADQTSIKAQVFDAGGAKVGSEFLVNTETAGQQLDPAVTALPNGGFVVAWEDRSRTLGDLDDWSIKAQVFDVNGAKVGGEFLVNTLTVGAQVDPSVTALTNSDFVITWSDASGALDDPFRFNIKASVFRIDTAEPPPPPPPLPEVKAIELSSIDLSGDHPLIVAAALATAAYLPDTAARQEAYTALLDSGWRPVSAANLDLAAGAVIEGYDGTTGRFESDFIIGLIASGALLLEGEVDGKSTLALSFRGTDDPLEYLQQAFLGWDELWADFKNFMDAVMAYAEDADFEQLIVSGHSLGGGLLQTFYHDYIYGGQNQFSADNTLAFTFGTPGSNQSTVADWENQNINKEDVRIVNIIHDEDPVAGREGDFFGDDAVLYGTDVIIERIEGLNGLFDPFEEHAMGLYVQSAGSIANAADGFSRDNTSSYAEKFAYIADTFSNFYFEASPYFGETNTRDLTSYSLTMLVGSEGADTLNGGLTEDIFSGGGGNDSINGGRDNDIFLGGGGNDTLIGGKDNDVAVYDGLRNEYTIDYISFASLKGAPLNARVPVGQQKSFWSVEGKDEGKDLLGEIEYLVFHDGLLVLGSLTPESQRFITNSNEINSVLQQSGFGSDLNWLFQ
ncbi:lipase family protein [Roseomonas rosulenta]|uniref:lipase family protein n=1 Tax=Roseomonas rosulenta TaxID=2748667 RepID=UPI0018DFD093|nr:hypothetical protein [Roseomonas rosulenta]